MKRTCDLDLIAKHLAAALQYAKAKNMDAHFISELDHLFKTVEHIRKEEGEK